MNGGLQQFFRNIARLPRTFAASAVRHGHPTSMRARSQAVFSNVFLHLHPTRVHRRTLRFSTTMGLGIVSLAAFILLCATGVLLMVYYKPSVDLAYDSIKDIHYAVPVGRFVRNIHRWAAHLMVAVVFLHMARVFFAGAYKSGREFNWVIGMGLFVLTLGLSFTGYLLPWDQLGYWAITVGSNIAASPRELTDALGVTQWFDPGGFQKELLLGSREVGQDALIRFYVLHVAVLPILLILLLAVHFWRVRKDGGLARPGEARTAAGEGAQAADIPAARAEEEPHKTYGLMCVVADHQPAVNLDPSDTVSSWPFLLRAEILLFMATMFVCVVLGVAFDAPLETLANPAIPENPAKAPWYFLGLQELVSYSAFMGGLAIPAITVLGLGLVPYLDRSEEDTGLWCAGRRGQRLALYSAIFGAVFAILAVAVPVSFGWVRSWFPQVNQLVIIFVNPGTLLTLAYAVWSLGVLKVTRSTRMGAIALFTCFLVGFVILTYVGTELRGPNWDFYWSRSEWPTH